MCVWPSEWVISEPLTLGGAGEPPGQEDAHNFIIIIVVVGSSSSSRIQTLPLPSRPVLLERKKAC